jgi:hypothetical protein
MTRRLPRLVLIAIAALGGLLIAPAVVLGHTVQHAGSYALEIGWSHEPTYVGDPNGVQVTITDSAEKPVTDLGPDDLHVVVTTASIPSPDLTFEPAFDLVEMTGPMGEYDAAIVPTAPGDYTFHITGTIHGQKVEITVTSGDETFDAVKETSNLQFPTKLPSVAEIATRLDRIDARVAALQGTTGPSQASVDAAQAAASAAQASADRALAIGVAVGGVGIIVGLLGLLAARRASRVPRAG